MVLLGVGLFLVGIVALIVTLFLSSEADKDGPVGMLVGALITIVSLFGAGYCLG